MAVTTTNLGVITAYGDAVAAGYTGTKAEWQALMASYATVGQQAVNAKNDAVAAKNTAVDKATEATTAANTATTKAGEASASAQSIAQSAAQIRENTDDIDELKNTFTATANSYVNNEKIIFPSSFVFGTLNVNGEIEAQSANRRIVTEKYITLTYDATICVNTGFSVIYCEYNNDLSLKSRSIKNGAISFTVTSGTIFRICILNATSEPAITSIAPYIDKAYIQKTKLGADVSKNSSDIAEAKANISTLQTKTQDIVNSLASFVASNLTYGGDGFVRTSGNVDPVADFHYYTIPVTANDVYKIKSYTGSAARLWLVKNSSNAVIAYSDDSSAPSTKTEMVTIPSDGVTLIINNYHASGSDLILSAEKLTLGRSDTIHSKLYGKVLCAVGDSITYGDDMDADGITNTSPIEMYQWSGMNSVWNKVESSFRHTYAYQIAERNNMLFWNGGVSGSTMQGIQDRRGFSLENGRYTQLPDHIDYLTIFFGWNDATYGTLGTLSDNTNESYYGGYNVVLPYLINKYPYAKIALIVPFGTDEGHRNAIRQLGNKWGVAVWDNYQGGTPLYYGKEDSVGVNASIVTANRAKFQANGAHPNYRGHKQLADMIEEFLKGI